MKSKAKELTFRDYKHFNHERFENNLKYTLSTFEKISYQEFENNIHRESQQTRFYDEEKVGKYKS